MMKFFFLRLILFCTSLNLIVSKTFSQNQSTGFSIRVPIQVENQKAHVTYGPDKTVRATTLNFGVDVLFNLHLNSKFIFNAGLGYFRERFSIERPYDHIALNPQTDSLLELLKTSYYDYDLLRMPISVQYVIVEHKILMVKAGIEYISSFSFRNKYNGKKPFPTAVNTVNDLRFFSHSLNLIASLNFKINDHRQFEITPFLRMLNSYKKDRFLYENSHENVNRYFDALGVYLEYSFIF